MIKSRLSVSYVEVLCSYLDLDCSEPKSGNDVSGWDVRIEPVRTRDEWKTKPRLFIQLKSMVYNSEGGYHISYSLDRRTYDELRKSSVRDCSLLAVLCLEDDPSQWVSTDDECLMMRRVMYWCKPTEYPEIENGSDSITLHIPLKNVLDKQTLHKMIDILSKGEVFGNEL